MGFPNVNLEVLSVWLEHCIYGSVLEAALLGFKCCVDLLLRNPYTCRGVTVFYTLLHTLL